MGRRPKVKLSSLIAVLSAAGLASCAVHAPRIASPARTPASNGPATNSIAMAEQAAAAHPDGAEARRQLGAAYLKAARYASAENAYADALSLDASDGRAALGQTLAMVALDKRDAAQRLLRAHLGTIDPHDTGLALVLVGEAQHGIAMLNAAYERNPSHARTRQNFAFALAMVGQMSDARLLAARDLAGAALDARLQQWAQLAGSGSPERVIAGLLGLPAAPASDPGMPAGLALTAPAPRSMLAGNDPAPLDLYAPAPETTASVAPAYVAPVAVATTPPVPVKPTAAMTTGRGTLASAARPAVPASSASQRPVQAAGRVAVQLGAYSDAKGAQAAWRRFGAGGALAGYRPVHERAVVNGRPVVRLLANGLPNVGAARAICQRLTLGYCATRTGAQMEHVASR